MKNSMPISVVVPVFNEEAYIPVTSEKIYDYFNAHFHEFEIIFVDDGSTDGSLKLLREWQRDKPEIKIIANQKHLGIGKALQCGFGAAEKEIIFYIDCDLPFELDFVEQAIPYLNDYDMVIGRRDRWDRWFQRPCSRVYDKIVEWFFGVDVPNINVGIKIFRRRILDGLMVKSVGWFFDTEFVVEVCRKGFKVKSLPLQYRRRLYGESKFSGLKSLVNTGAELAEYFYRQKKSGDKG
jgi:glycosyltransferase involved in cell wall biosynthesis